MLQIPGEESVLAKLVAWGKLHPFIRAMIMSSSRTRPMGPVDTLSDYDIILCVSDAERFAREDKWHSDFGPILVRWGDQSETLGHTTYFRGLIYEDGVKIDYSIWPTTLITAIAAQPLLPDQLDVGYRVLLDKDGAASQLRPPTFRAHIPARPTEAAYIALIEEFWWSATYVAKSLWRDELAFAKFCLDQDIRDSTLRPMLEWRIEIDHAWSVKPGVHGRTLKQLLPADLWDQVEASYAARGIEENWESLHRTAALFSRVATEVGQALGYSYPRELEVKMLEYISGIRHLPRECD